ncbi:MAG: sigma-54-dependent Fis family transcriptional regulator [Proteobacteria bacterium]|nr:sigma-54-dependent Fis family transcriptional regulator [Burkholderiales bacterium]
MAQATNKPDLLIVDDDPLITDTLDFTLSADYEVLVAASRAQVHSLLRQIERTPRLALIDLGLPPSPHRPDEGFRLIGELLAAAPEMKIIVLSGQNDEANARHARAIGAIDFVAKPCSPDRLKALLANAHGLLATERPVDGSERAIVGSSPAIERLRQQIEQYAAAPFPVLIEGESGSGKELVARALHRKSGHATRPLVALNCAAIAPTLVEPTLFGFAKGAFTGAIGARAGYFEDAADSTLFLDEIGELPFELQSKLLRVLENGEFQRIGETTSRHSNARVIAATNRDLRQEVKAGRFRGDLYHRLSVFAITVPPLRDLDQDKRLLLDHFSAHYASAAARAPFELDAESERLWLEYGFPGNVRELRNIVIRLSTKYPGQRVAAAQLLAEMDVDAGESAPGALYPSAADGDDDRQAIDAARRHLGSVRAVDLDRLLRSWERSYIEAALFLTHGNLAQAARMLGLHRTTLYSRMQARERGTDAPENR